jgi:hypothetical protein
VVKKFTTQKRCVLSLDQQNKTKDEDNDKKICKSIQEIPVETKQKVMNHFYDNLLKINPFAE